MGSVAVQEFLIGVGAGQAEQHLAGVDADSGKIGAYAVRRVEGDRHRLLWSHGECIGSEVERGLFEENVERCRMMGVKDRGTDLEAMAGRAAVETGPGFFDRLGGSIENGDTESHLSDASNQICGTRQAA